jgi:hypothetical protein
MQPKSEIKGNYTVRLRVAGREFFGKADMPQQAKHFACDVAIPIIKTLRDASNFAAMLSETSAAADASSTSTPQRASSSDPNVWKNPVTRVHEIATNHSLHAAFELVSEQVKIECVRVREDC